MFIKLCNLYNFCLFFILLTVTNITRRITHVFFFFLLLFFFNSTFYCLQRLFAVVQYITYSRTYRYSGMCRPPNAKKFAHHAHPNIPLHMHIARFKNMIFIYDSVRSLCYIFIDVFLFKLSLAICNCRWKYSFFLKNSKFKTIIVLYRATLNKLQTHLRMIANHVPI